MAFPMQGGGDRNYPTTAPLTNTQLRAAAVTVDGTVAVTDGGASITVDGPLTDAQLRATPLPVSAVSLPLPTGAATEGGLSALAAILDNIVTALDEIKANQDSQAALHAETVVTITEAFTASPAFGANTVGPLTRPTAAFGLQVYGNGGSPTAWDIRLEASLDPTAGWTQILQHSSATPTLLGTTLWTGALNRFVAVYWRVRIANSPTPINLNGATSLGVKIVGVPDA